MTTRILPVLLGLTAACGADTPDDTASDAADPPEELLTLTEQEVPEAGMCGAWSGIHAAGSTWRYQYRHSVGDSVMQVTGYDPDSGTVELVHMYEIRHGTLWEEGIQKLTFTCDEVGLWLHRIETEGSINAITSSIEEVYDSPMLVLPAELSVGDAWESVGRGTRTTVGVTEPFEVAATHEVLDFVHLNVPAGNFVPLKIRTTSDGETTHSWLVEGLGVVKDSEVELLWYHTP